MPTRTALEKLKSLTHNATIPHSKCSFVDTAAFKGTSTERCCSLETTQDRTRREGAATSFFTPNSPTQRPQFPSLAPTYSRFPPSSPHCPPMCSPTSRLIGSPPVMGQRGASCVVCLVFSGKVGESPPAHGMGMPPNCMASCSSRAALDRGWEVLQSLSGTLSGAWDGLVAPCVVGMKHQDLLHRSQSGLRCGGSGGHGAHRHQ